MAARLESDEVNYLIWRYLQEFGLAQTAARLQRDWGQANPDALPFAQSIQPYALIRLLHKGLRYHEIESSIDQSGARRPPAPFFQATSSSAPRTDAAPARPAARAGSQSPSHKSLAPAPLHGPAGAEADVTGPPPAKRSRRSNGFSGRERADDAMDVDAAETSIEADARSDTRRASPIHHSSAVPIASNAMDLDQNIKIDPALRDAASRPTPHANEPVDAGLPENLSGETAPGGSTLPIANGTVSHYPKSSEGESTLTYSAPESAPEAAGSLSAVAPPVLTLTSGRSVGMQSDKIADLVTETAVLTAAPAREVNHVQWNPKRPALLAAGGDALCRIWTLPASTRSQARAGQLPSPPASAPNTSTSSRDRSVDTSVQTADLDEAADSALTTALAWSPDGERLAVAVHPDITAARGSIFIQSAAGETLDELPGAQDWVLHLAWTRSQSLLLGVTNSGGSASLVMAWDLASRRTLEPCQVPAIVMGVACIDDRTFVICGPDLLSLVQLRDGALELGSERLDASSPRAWSRVRHDPISQTIAVASESTGALGLLAASGAFSTTLAHPHSEITALEYQPLADPPALSPDSPRLLATAGTDSCIRLWNARHTPLQCLRSLQVDSDAPALAMSFSPDGYALAGATWNRVLFWNPEIGEPPKAVWNGKLLDWPIPPAAAAAAAGLASPGHNALLAPTATADGGTTMTDGDWTHSLSWDADGKRVAFGAKDQIAVISFVR